LSGDEEVVAAKREPGATQDVEHWQDGRAPHVVGRRPSLVREAEQEDAPALEPPARLTEELEEPAGHVAWEVLVQGARAWHEPRLVPHGPRTLDQDVGILRQAAASDEAGTRQIRPRVLQIRGTAELQRVESQSLPHDGPLVAERVDQLRESVVEDRQ